MKTTPIDEIEDLADGVPVLAVEGTVKYAQELKHSPADAKHPWTKQFFVLSSGTAEIACSMWDAEGSELSKGEKVHIENTKNKKGVWSGMTKGSYQKDGERKHTLEIRCNQVKITEANGISTMNDISTLEAEERLNRRLPDPDCPEAPDSVGGMFRGSVANAPQSPPTHPLNDAGVTEARKHLMRAANLYNLCIKCVDKTIAPNLPTVAQTSEQFQATLASLWIEASSRRCTDGVNWWSYIDRMPEKPI